MADNEVNIKIKAIDETGKTIKNVVGGLKGVGKEIAEINTLAKAQALQSIGRDLTQYFGMAQKAISGVVKEYADYAEQVRALTRLTGANSEQSSRAIQLADDLKISYQSMSSALEAGVRKGVNPSIESLAALSDQYIKLQPGLEQSTFLMENFGRTGMDLAPMMELGSRALLEMNDAVDKSLILTDEQVQKAREAEIALDNYNDKVQALRFSIGRDLIGAFVAAPKPMQDFVLTLSAIGPSIAGVIGFAFQLTGTIKNLGILLPGVSTAIAGFGTALKGVVAFAGPIGALAAAIGLLIIVLDKFGPDAWLAAKRLFALGMRPFVSDQQFIQGSQNLGLIGHAEGGSINAGRSYMVGERGPELLSMGASGGYVTPMRGGRGGGGGGVTIVYSPTISTASQDEIERIGAIIENTLRRRP